VKKRKNIMNETITKIICPYCKREIPLDEALTHQIKEKIQQELRDEFNKKELELKSKEDDIIKKEKELQRLKEEQAKEIAKMQERLEKDLHTRLEQEKKKIEDSIRKRVAEESALEIKTLKDELAEKANKIKEFKDLELTLRKEKRRLEEEKQNLKLEVARKLDAEREKLKEDIEKRISEQHRLKDLEKDKLIEAMKTQIEELKRKAEQGSQQMQGEVLEIELEGLLKKNFPHDEVIPVPKGMRGADVIQRVCTPYGQQCGTIIWESKRTKAWSDSWIEKLKEDQRNAKADIAVIVSVTMPKDITGIGQINGVWVTDYTLATSLAMALRMVLIEVAKVKTAIEGKSGKMEMLYEYLSGPEFRQQIEGIVEAFVSMKNDLDAEKRAMEKIWAKREKQIEKVVRNTSRMYGSLQGIIGSTLPELKALELKALKGNEGQKTEDRPLR